MLSPFIIHRLSAHKSSRVHSTMGRRWAIWPGILNLQLKSVVFQAGALRVGTIRICKNVFKKASVLAHWQLAIEYRPLISRDAGATSISNGEYLTMLNRQLPLAGGRFPNF